jgi:hypothetical protein
MRIKRMHLTVGAPVTEPHRLQVMRGVRWALQQ